MKINKVNKIDKKEVLRYLGYKSQFFSVISGDISLENPLKISPELDSLIDSCIAECENIARPFGIYKIFDITQEKSKIEKNRILENKILLGSLVLAGADIAKYLRGSSECVIMAATLGVEIDSLIRATQLSDMTRAVILDACANDLIEKYCDEINIKIAQNIKTKKLVLKPRFSPGYGDFPLETQSVVLDLLDAQKKIGLTCTSDFIMIPQKSVTALIALGQSIGLGQNLETLELETFEINKCDLCNMTEKCAYFKL